MDQKLHVVQSKLLNVVPELVFLIHTLEKSQGSGPHLKIKQTAIEKYDNHRKRRCADSECELDMNRIWTRKVITFSFSCELRSRSTCRY